MNIAVLIAAVANKTAGWEDLLIDEWECIQTHYPNYIKLLEILSGQGVNPNATSGQNLIEALVDGVAIGTTFEAPGSGTPYALTNTAAAINLGTDDPVANLVEAGKYIIFGQVHLAANGATVVAETASIKVRRTNNTPADVSQVVVLDLPVMTTLTHSLGIFQIPPFGYIAGVSSDSLTLFANVSAALGAGTIDAIGIGTSLFAMRVSGS